MEKIDMFDDLIINIIHEEQKRKEQEQHERPQLELPLPQYDYNSSSYEPEVEDGCRGIVIIDI